MFSCIYILFLTINKNPKQILNNSYKILKHLEKKYDFSIETPRDYCIHISYTEMFFRSQTNKFSAIGLRITLNEAYYDAALQILIDNIKSKDISLQKLQNNLQNILLAHIQSHLNSYLKLNY